MQTYLYETELSSYFQLNYIQIAPIKTTETHR